MAQLHGSTESSSQLFKTPWGSFKASLKLIKASTARNRTQITKSVTFLKKSSEIVCEVVRFGVYTFMVARLVGETEGSRREEEGKSEEAEELEKNHG